MKHIVHVVATIERDVEVNIPNTSEPMSNHEIEEFAKQNFKLPPGTVWKNDSLYIATQHVMTLPFSPGGISDESKKMMHLQYKETQNVD